MKKLLTICILLSIITVGYTQSLKKYEPGVLLGKNYKEVKMVYTHYDEYALTIVTDSTLTFFNWREDMIAVYTFKEYKGKRYCVKCELTVDCLTGEELIGLHHKDWTPINDMQWEYDSPAYDIPLTVTLQYVDGFMQFSYRYIPKRD